MEKEQLLLRAATVLAATDVDEMNVFQRKNHYLMRIKDYPEGNLKFILLAGKVTDPELLLDWLDEEDFPGDYSDEITLGDIDLYP